MIKKFIVANGNEYEYDINAQTGEIVKKGVEAIRTAHKAKTNTKTQNNKPQQAKPQQTKPQQTSSISMERAKQIALSNAGVSATECRDMDIEKDYNRGVLVWEVGFKCGNYEYDFDIDAKTGAIVDKDVEYDD